MTRLFLRIMYMTFLWVILIANLIFAFDLTSIISPLSGGVYSGDLSNRYFGVSTLIEAFRNIDNMSIGKFALQLGTHQKQVFNTIDNLKNLTSNYSYALESATDILAFLRNIVRIVGMIANTVAMIGMYIYSFGVSMVYYSTLFFELLYMFMAFFSGYYSSELPSTVSQSVSNCITPLLTAF